MSVTKVELTTFVMGEGELGEALLITFGDGRVRKITMHTGGGMTRAESYSEGWHEGRLWAEYNIMNGIPLERDIREDAFEDCLEGIARAFALGAARGYRQAVADFESGRLSWEQFEIEPRSPR